MGFSAELVSFYSSRRPVFGMINHSTSSAPIMATNLPKTNEVHSVETGRMSRKDIYTYIGCKASMPAFDATAPAINGTNADPVWPNPAIQPTAPVISQ